MSYISIVRGYHGTTLTDANRIVTRRTIRKRVRPYHWLGQGIYFFEDAPVRAWAWALYRAKQTPNAQPAVVSGVIVLRDCFDLLDIGTYAYLRKARELLERETTPTPLPQQQPAFYRRHDNTKSRVPLGTPLPTPPEQNYNFLDCAVVERAVVLAEALSKVPVRSVRGAFLEGQNLYENSYFFDRSHVQIAVRDPGMISDLYIEPAAELRRKFGQPKF